MGTTVGFKRLIVRILDGKQDVEEGKNLFIIEGKADKGATQTAKISGLASEATKSYGSNLAYYVSRKGVGDVKVDFTLLDMPDIVENTILGYEEKNGLTLVGENTEAPYCAVMMESTTLGGEPVVFGLFKGTFTRDEKELETTKEKQDELAGDSFSFTAIAADKDEYKGYYYLKAVGSEKVTKAKEALDMATAASA